MRNISARARSGVLGLALLGAAAPSLAQAPPTQGASPQEHRTFDKTLEQQAHLEYLLALPDGYRQDGPAWPLVLFLHGAGERGSDLDKVKTHGPPKLIEAGQKLPAIVVSPQCPDGHWWTEYDDALLALLDELQARYNVDPDRVYLTGLSMGGFGTWSLLATSPERFAAAIPICGGGAPFSVALRAREVPIWAFHGDADPVVPVTESQRMVEAITKRGGTKVRLTTYPGVGHDAWTQTYDDPKVWEWLFAQRRGSAGTAGQGSR